MEFKCTCGHQVADETDGIPNKAMLISEDDFEVYASRVDTAIIEFIDALLADKRKEWMDKHFMEDYPANLSNGQMLGDILNWIYLGRQKEMYQCDSCGRIWIEKDGVNLSFKPESEGQGGVLN